MSLLQTEGSCSTISVRPHGPLIIQGMNIHMTTQVRMEQKEIIIETNDWWEEVFFSPFFWLRLFPKRSFTDVCFMSVE